ncbi:hypothetical protein [Haloparvum sp. PAK95]
MSKQSGDDDRRDDHLADVDDGCGCVEVWEAMSERRHDASSVAED